VRTPIIAGNWKMNTTVQEAEALAAGIVAQLPDPLPVQVVVCPPFISLAAVCEAVCGSGVALGAQNMFWKESGAYTGEVSPTMLTSVGVQYVIIGHSERRGRFGVAEEGMTAELLTVFGENDQTVNAKVKAAFHHDLTPIVCCGELLAERQAGQTDEVVRGQVRAALAGLTAEQIPHLIFAYEPVWAIGTGEVCDSPEANRVCGLIRATVAELFDAACAGQTRIQYGGSVKPDNARELMSQPEIDGALVGGASLKAGGFVEIIKATQEAKPNG